MRVSRIAAGSFGVLLILLFAAAADATQRFGPVELSGNLQSQNLIRTPDESTFEFIQNRNTARIRLDYEWLVGGKFYGKYDIPFIERSKMSIYWRGVYDSVYDLTPGFLQKRDIHGQAYGGMDYFERATQVGVPAGKSLALQKMNINQLGLNMLGSSGRDALKFDNQLREFYVDLKVRGMPLTVRAGRQQIVWGETDNFRMLDRANSLDLTWHFQQEIPGPAFGWDEIRRPFWMIKFLYDLGDVWKLSQNYLEWYWNPGDWQPAKQAFLPRPWGLPFYNPLTNPVDGAFYDAPCNGSSVIETHGIRAGQAHCTRLINDTRLFERGNWTRDPFDNSQVGVRYHGIAPFGMEFTLDYFYQRWAGDDGTNYAPLRAPLKTYKNNGADDVATLNRLVGHGIFPAEYIAPYVHTLGASANYSDETFTQAVIRFETVYDVGIPFFDVRKISIIDDPQLPGVTKKNMWKGMIAFDRPTWIRTLNKKSTFFITGQFFWHYMVNNPDCKFRNAEGAQDVARLYATLGKQGPLPADAPSCLVGGLDLPSSVRTGKDTLHQAFRDKIRDWETLATLAIFTFYKGGSIVPTLGIAVDPTNQFNMEPFWSLEYVMRDDLIINLAQRYFVTPRGHHSPTFETWGLAGLNAGRSETSLRVTFQF